MINKCSKIHRMCLDKRIFVVKYMTSFNTREKMALLDMAVDINYMRGTYILEESIDFVKKGGC